MAFRVRRGMKQGLETFIGSSGFRGCQDDVKMKSPPKWKTPIEQKIFSDFSMTHRIPAQESSTASRMASCGDATFCRAKLDGSYCDGAYSKTCSDNTQTDRA